MSKSKDLRHRAVCPHCGKSFDIREEDFKLDGKIVCADCYHKRGHYVTLDEYQKYPRKK